VTTNFKQSSPGTSDDKVWVATSGQVMPPNVKTKLSEIFLLTNFIVLLVEDAVPPSFSNTLTASKFV
jgi:hypothetical protein